MARHMILVAWAGLAASLAVSPAAAQDETGDWRYVGRDEAFAYGWDFAALTREGDIARTKTIRSYLPVELEPNGIPASIIIPSEAYIDYDYEIAAVVIDCASRQFTVDRFTKYDEAGEVVATEEVEEGWYPFMGAVTVFGPLACNGDPRLRPQPQVSTAGFAVNVREMAGIAPD